MEQPGHARETDIGIEYFITKYFKELGTLFQNLQSHDLSVAL
jgi:hypothetical protein